MAITDTGDIQGPAWMRSGYFVQDRHLTKGIGAPMGWSRLHPLQVGFDANPSKLLGKSDPAEKAKSRLTAGMLFWDTYCLAQKPSGRDSTDLERFSSSIGGGNASAGRIDAQRRLERIKANMGFMDYQIIERTVGEGYGAADTMRTLFASDYRDSVWARLRESLDSLIKAMS